MRRFVRFFPLLSAIPALIVVIPLTAAPPPHIAAACNSNGDGFFGVAVPLPEGVSAGELVAVAVVESGDIRSVFASVTSSPPPWEAQSEPTPNRPSGLRTAAKRPDGPRRLHLVGRFGAPGPARVVVRIRAAHDAQAEEVETAVPISIAETGAPCDRLVQAWAMQMGAHLHGAARRGRDPFIGYWDLVASKRYGVESPSEPVRGGMNPQPPDLYSVFTGHAAIEESLQLQALGAQGRPAVPRGPAPAVATPPAPTGLRPMAALPGPAVKSHPFVEMLGGKVPTVPALARFIPEDQYAVFFSDFNKQTELADLMDEWGGNILREIAASARDFRVREKIASQLCLETGALARLFGSRVIGAMAFTGGDPFFMEGTDFTVLFELKRKEAFLRHLEGRYADAAKANGARRSASVLSGREAVSVTTPDRRVCSHFVVLGDVAVVSNSTEALRRVVDTAGTGLPSLATAPDFLYLRTIFPHGDPDEDVFIYLSDAHIRRLVGPRWKIGEARRLRCAGNLSLLANARFWFKAEKRREPGIEALLAGGYLGTTAPACPDGGSYALEPESGEPVCSVHNRSGCLTPVAEIPLETATAEEAAQYEGFVANYNRYWSRFFDPIGIRVGLGDTVRIETCILPLIENSWYDSLVSLSGREAGPLPEASVLPRTVVSVRARLSPDWRKRYEVLRLMTSRGPVPLDWLGNDVSINLCDGQPLVVAGGGGVGFFGQGPGRSAMAQVAFGYLASALSLPAYFSASVTDPSLAERMVPQLFDAYSRNDPFAAFSVETYALESHRGKPVHAATITVFGVKARLFGAVAGDRLVVATRRDVVSDLLDASGATAATAGARTGNAELAVYRRAFRQLAPAVTLGYQEQARQSCQKNLALAEILLGWGGVPPERLGDAAFALRGYEPYCPSGGHYLLDPATGRAACSVHGTAERPRQPDAVDERSPTPALVDRLKTVRATLAFTPEGLMATLSVERAPRAWWKPWR